MTIIINLGTRINPLIKWYFLKQKLEHQKIVLSVNAKEF